MERLPMAVNCKAQRRSQIDTYVILMQFLLKDQKDLLT